MFENEYDSWNKIKKTIAKESDDIFCNKREVWWCSIGMNIGTEIYGKNDKFERPILVLKVYNRRTILAVPLSSKIKLGKYCVTIEVHNSISCVQLSQIRVLSTKRLTRKITRLDKEQFEKVMDQYKRSL